MNFSITPVLTLIAAVFLTACGTPEQYYLLTAETAVGTTSSSRAGAVGLGPVRIPDYIDRSEIVFQSAPNRFEIPASHHWAGALEPTITRVLATNLGAQLPGQSVQPYPWDPGGKPGFSVPVEIAQFHSVSGGDAVLDASWKVVDGETGKTLTDRSITLREPMATAGYDGIVAAQSRLLARLAEQIAPTVPRQ